MLIRFIKRYIPYGRFIALGRFWIHLWVLILKRFFRVTVAGVVWKEDTKGSRTALVLRKLSLRLREGHVLFEETYDIAKGGWRDGDGAFFESLKLAMLRELHEEAGIASNSVVKMELVGIAFQQLSKHNRYRHKRFQCGKLYVVFNVQVTSDTVWKRSTDNRITGGEFRSDATVCFQPKNSDKKHVKYDILRSFDF